MRTTGSQSDRTVTSSIGYRQSANKRHLALLVLGQTAGSGLGLALKGLAQFPLFGQLPYDHAWSGTSRTVVPRSRVRVAVNCGEATAHLLLT